MKSKEERILEIEKLKQKKSELLHLANYELPNQRYDEIMRWQDIYMEDASQKNLRKGIAEIDRRIKKERLRLYRQAKFCGLRIKILETLTKNFKSR